MHSAMAFVPAVAMPLRGRSSLSVLKSSARPVRTTSRVRPALVIRSCAAADTDAESTSSPASDATSPAADASEAVVEADPSATETESTEASVDSAAPAAVADASASKDPPSGEEKSRRAGGNRRGGGGRAKKEVTVKLEDMEVGQEIEGTVKSTTTYGAFVGDMGTPTDGLLHVSQLAAGFVENVTDVVNTGDKIKVRVLSIDLEKGNFSLTMKPPQSAAEAADSAERRSGGGGGTRGGGSASAQKWKDFKFDSTKYVQAKVVSVAAFGAFCKLLDADGNEDASVPTDGLIHISEISDEHVTDVSSVLSVGQTVKARVTDTDKKRNRISLSLKEWKAGETETLAEDMAASAAAQPEFKTTMELAFERARAKQN